MLNCMPLVRRIQRKGEYLYIRIPKQSATLLDLRPGQYVLIHTLNNEQMIFTKLKGDLPIIKYEEEVAT